jgi:hypothetical protein
MQPIPIQTMGAQGDVLFRRVAKLPKGLTEVDPKSRRKVVAHSETGHHHAIDDAGVKMYQGEDPLTCFLVLESVEHCDVVHYRPWDTHATLRLLGGGTTGGVFQVRRQREYTPQGWRRVED